MPGDKYTVTLVDKVSGPAKKVIAILDKLGRKRNHVDKKMQKNTAASERAAAKLAAHQAKLAATQAKAAEREAMHKERLAARVARASAKRDKAIGKASANTTKRTAATRKKSEVDQAKVFAKRHAAAERNQRAAKKRAAARRKNAMSERNRIAKNFARRHAAAERFQKAANKRAAVRRKNAMAERSRVAKLDAPKRIRRTTKAIRQQTQAQRGGSVTATAFGASIGIAATALARYAAVAAKDAIVSTVKLGVEISKTDTAFGLLTGSLAKGKALHRNVAKEAAAMGMDINVATQSMSNLLRAGFSQGASMNVIRMAGDLSALGASSGQVTQFMESMGRSMAQGKVELEEFKSVAVSSGIAVPAIYSRIAKNMGKTVEQVKKLQSQGKLMAKDFVPAVMQLHKAKFGEFGETAKKAIDPIAKIGGKYELFKRELSEKVAPAVFKELAPEIDGLMKSMSGKEGKENIKAITGVIKAVIKGVKAMVKAFRPFLKEMAFASGMDLDSVEGFEKTAEKVGTAVGKALGTIGVLIASFVGLVSWVASADAALLKFNRSAGERLGDALSGAGKGFVDANMGIGEFILNLGESIGSGVMTVMAKAMALGSAIVNGLKVAILAGAGAVISAVSGVVSGAINTAKALIKPGSPSKVFKKLGSQVAEGYEVGIQGGTAPAQAAAKDLVNPSSVMSMKQRPSNTINQSMSSAFTIQAADDPEATAAAVRRILSDELEGAFAQVAIEVGILPSSA